jgi:hypothetical protein
MEVCGSDGQTIGKVHRLFSGARVHPEGVDHPDIDLDPADEDSRHLGDLASTYDAALLGSADYGSSQVSGIAPFATPDRAPGGSEMPEGAMTFSPSDTKFMEVRHHGLLGLKSETVYVPFDAVDAISPDSITLACSREDALRIYGNRPAPVEDEPPLT